MKLYRAGIAAAGLVAVLVASAASAGDQFKLAAPEGWVKKAGSGMVLAIWVEPTSNGFHQNLTLLTEPFAGSEADYVAAHKATTKKSIPGVEFGPEADVKTCADHPAHFLSFKSTSSGRHLLFEQVVSVWFNR